MMQHLSSEAIQEGMSHFTGTEGYTELGPKTLLTDGAVWLAENAGCFWLFQDAAIYLHGHEKKDDFQVVRLDILEDDSFRVEAGDGNGNWRALFTGEFTDFPEDLLPFEFYASFNHELRAWVFLLKSEY